MTPTGSIASAGPGGDNNIGGSNTSAAVSLDDDRGDSNDGEVDIVTSLECKGKFIYLILDSCRNKLDANATTDDYQRSIWITLGMTGQFVNEDRIHDANVDKKASDPRWYMELMDVATRKTRRIYYRDARNFGTLRFVLSAKELNDKLDTLGADLLDDGTTEDVFLEAMDKSVQRRNICKFLMDQGKIAGVG
jgi:formamidopyrimidine-DNA glycosylase